MGKRCREYRITLILSRDDGDYEDGDDVPSFPSPEKLEFILNNSTTLESIGESTRLDPSLLRVEG